MTRRHSIQTPDVTQQVQGQSGEIIESLMPHASAEYQATPDALLQSSPDIVIADCVAKVSYCLSSHPFDAAP